VRFSLKANSYHRKADIQKVIADWCTEWIEADVRNLRALELGAGTGLLTRHLALRGFEELVATDISLQMLEEGRRRIPFVTWRKLDAWVEREEPVDRLYACSLLQWAKDPAAVLENWRRNLVPGGKLLAGVFLKGSLSEFEKVSDRFPALSWRDADQWIEYFERAGFDVLRKETRVDTVSFLTAREALRSLHDIGAVEERRMSLSDLRRFLVRCEEEHKSPFLMTWKAMRIECISR
jgi:malonyl-CoA O-methyltransferase